MVAEFAQDGSNPSMLFTSTSKIGALVEILYRNGAKGENILYVLPEGTSCSGAKYADKYTSNQATEVRFWKYENKSHA